MINSNSQTEKYKPTQFMAKILHCDKETADFAVMLIECLRPKGTRSGIPFELIDRQEQLIRSLFGALKPNDCRQFNTV